MRRTRGEVRGPAWRNLRQVGRAKMTKQQVIESHRHVFSRAMGRRCPRASKAFPPNRLGFAERDCLSEELVSDLRL